MGDFGELEASGCGLVVIPAQNKQEFGHSQPPFFDRSPQGDRRIQPFRQKIP
jgi:hypothetical protein